MTACCCLLFALLAAPAPTTTPVDRPQPPAKAERADPKPKQIEARIYRRTPKGWEEVADPNELKKGDLVLLFLKNDAGKWDVRPARIAADVKGGKVEFEDAPFPGEEKKDDV